MGVPVVPSHPVVVVVVVVVVVMASSGTLPWLEPWVRALVVATIVAPPSTVTLATSVGAVSGVDNDRSMVVFCKAATAARTCSHEVPDTVKSQSLAVFLSPVVVVVVVVVVVLTRFFLIVTSCLRLRVRNFA